MVEGKINSQHDKDVNGGFGTKKEVGLHGLRYDSALWVSTYT